MSSVVISGDTSGSITLQAPAVAGTTTLTLPAATGTVMVSGNMPACFVYANSSQSLANSTNTKVAFDTKLYDTSSAFNTSTNRFQPTVAGYYQVSTAYSFGGATYTRNLIRLYVTGNEYSRLYDVGYSVGVIYTVLTLSGSQLVYLNGSTDYVETWVQQTSGGSVSGGSGSINVYFQASLVRAA